MGKESMVFRDLFASVISGGTINTTTATSTDLIRAVYDESGANPALRIYGSDGGGSGSSGSSGSSGINGANGTNGTSGSSGTNGTSGSSGTSGGGANITTGVTYMVSNITLTSSDTYYSGITITLSAGTYLIIARTSIEGPSDGSFRIYTSKIHTGTGTTYLENYTADRTSVGVYYTPFIMLNNFITISESTQITLSAKCNAASTTLIASTNTYIMYMKIN